MGCHSVAEVVERMTKLAYLTATGEVGTLGADWEGVLEIEGGPWSQKPVGVGMRRSSGYWTIRVRLEGGQTEFACQNPFILARCEILPAGRRRWQDKGYRA